MSGDTNVHRVVGNLLVGTSHFFVDTTTNQVGVNTSTPSAALDVASGDLKVGSDITLASGGTITAANFSGNGSGLSDINSDSGSWVKDDANSKIYVANSAHKVAIGTTSVSELLTVGNDSVNADVVNNIRLNGRKASADGEICGLYFANSKDTGDGTTGSSASIRASRIGGSNFATQLDFYTNDGAAVGSGTSRLTILGSGNVGIGTSSPSKTLVVGGDVAFPQSVTSTDSHNTTDRALYIGGKDYNGSLIQAKCAIISSPLAANGGLEQYGRNSLHFCVGPDSQDDVNASVSNSRLSIDHSGNVGVGSTSPTGRLEVAYTEGTLSSYSYATSSTWHNKGLALKGGNAGFLYGHDINHSIFLRQSPFGATDHNAYCNVGYHAFYTGGHIQNQTEKMRIASDGKILLQGFEVKQQIIGYLSSRFGSAYSYDWAPSGNQNTWKDTKVINYTRKKAGTKIMVRFTACTSKAIGDTNYRATYLRVDSRLKITTANGAVSYSSALADWNRSDYGFFEAENLRYDFFDAGTLSGSSANQNISFTFQVLGTANNGHVGRFGLNLWANNTPISGIEVYEIINE